MKSFCSYFVGTFKGVDNLYLKLFLVIGSLGKNTWFKEMCNVKSAVRAYVYIIICEALHLS